MAQNQFDTAVWTALSQRYTDFERIGEGGMAVVYKAYDTTLLRVVAIKTMSHERMTPDMVLRFQQEARTASKLVHPNLITVLDFGAVENDRPYLVMDYVEGKTLESLLNETDYLSVSETIAIALEVCRGMAYAHKNGVIHRDLKPSNILLLNKPEPDARVKVVDFGIAKLKESTNAELTSVHKKTARHERRSADRESRSKTGELVGSPFYMSPEQIRGEEVDERADVYSMGCILFRMLSGTAPFEGETHLETYSMHLNELPPVIVEPVLPEQLLTLIDKCLAKSPEERPASMMEVADVLKSIPSQRPATEVETDRKKAQVAKKYKMGPVGTACSSLIFIVLLSLVVWQFQRQPAADPVPAKPVAVIKAQELHENNWKLTKEPGEPEVLQCLTTGATDEDLDYVIENGYTKLSLKNSKVTERGLKKLAGVPITYLDLAHTQLGDSAAPYLAQLRNLEYLNLSSTAFTDKGVKELAALKQLHSLYLDQLTGITDESADAIVKQWPNLIALNVAKTSLKGKGLQRLNDLSQLRGLDVAELKLPDKVMEQILRRDQLRELNLNHSVFSKKYLMQLPKMARLRLLLISEVPGLETKDYEELQRAFGPRCQVQCFNNLNQELPDLGPMVEMIGGETDH